MLIVPQTNDNVKDISNCCSGQSLLNFRELDTARHLQKQLSLPINAFELIMIQDGNVTEKNSCRCLQNKGTTVLQNNI